MTPNPLRRALALAVSLTLAAGMALVAAPAAQALPTGTADLTGISVSAGPLSPEFDPATLSYTVAVPYASKTVEITLSATSEKTLKISNVPVSAGVPFPVSVNFTGGSHFAIEVSAPGVTPRLYIVWITRGQASTNATLTDMSLSVGTLVPPFTATGTSYTATVPYRTTTLDVLGTAESSTAQVQVSGPKVPSGGVPRPVTLAVGENRIIVTVAAENSSVTTVRTIVVTREPANMNLRALTVTGGTLTPAFTPGNTAYTLALPYSVSTVDVSGTADDAGWPVSYQSRSAVVPGQAIPVAVGTSKIHAVVQGLDRDNRAYTITVTRGAASTDTALGSLTLSDGDLSPEFSATETDYSATVGYATSTITVGATAAKATTSVTINGAKTTSADVALAAGPNTITIVTTAEDGTTTKTTTVTVTRAAPATNADLSGITLSSGSLSPVFSAEATSYTATVGYSTEKITVGATAASTTATVSINGKSAASAPIALNVGQNTITIVTTAQNGSTKTTTVLVTRAAAPVADLTITLGFAAGDQATNAPAQMTGSNLLPGSEAIITMHSTPVVLARGIVQADGTITLSARIPANAEAGAHRLVFSGTALNGTAVSETAWFTVLKNGTIGAASATAPVAYVEPPVAPKPGAVAPGGSTSGKSSPLATTGVESGFGAMAGAAFAVVGAALLLLGGVLRRRRNAA